MIWESSEESLYIKEKDRGDEMTYFLPDAKAIDQVRGGGCNVL